LGAEEAHNIGPVRGSPYSEEYSGSDAEVAAENEEYSEDVSSLAVIG